MCIFKESRQCGHTHPHVEDYGQFPFLTQYVFVQQLTTVLKKKKVVVIVTATLYIFTLAERGGSPEWVLPGRYQYPTWIFGRAEKAWSELNRVKCLRAFKKGLSFPRFRSSIYFFGSNFLYRIKTCYRAGDVPAEPPGSLFCLEDVPISTRPRKLHRPRHTSNRREEFPLRKYLLFPFWHMKQHLKRDRDSWILYSESAWT